MFLALGLNMIVALIMDLNGVRFPGNYWVQGLQVGVVVFAGWQAGRYVARKKDGAEISDQRHQ